MKRNYSVILISSNKKGKFNYNFLDEYKAGLVLTGTEIKSIREKKVNINDSYCVFIENELFIKQMHIPLYKNGTIYNHEETRIRKLLLKKNELLKIKRQLTPGITVIAKELFINERGLAKLTIAVAKGKKIYDKRETIKKRDLERRIKHGID